MGGRRRPECKRRTRFGSRRLSSSTRPAAWQAEHKLPYTFPQPEWGTAAKTLREFFLAREIPETTVWPLKLREF